MISFGNISKKLCAVCIPAVILLSGCSADSYDSSAMRDMPAEIIIDGRTENVAPGRYIFWGKRC